MGARGLFSSAVDPTERRVSWSSLRRGILLIGVGALALGGVAWVLPSEAGVTLKPAERLLATAVLASLGAGVALLALLLAGTKRRVALGVPVLLPTALALSLAVAPRTGRIRVRVDDEWIALIVVAAVLVAILARSRVAPAVVGLLGCWSIAATGVVQSQTSHPELGLQSPSDQPAGHLVLITLDTVRADHFEFVRAGSSIPSSTPSLSALARESVVFQQAFSTSALTGPSHATILSPG